MCDVSIIIPTYNRCKLLGITLQSICVQNLENISMEVIIVDDGSTDDTSKIVAQYKQSIENIKYIYSEHNGYRVAYVRNLGIKQSSGEILIFVDSGMILCRDFVRRHYQSHLDHDKNVAIGSIYGYTILQSDQTFNKLVDVNDIEKTFNNIEKMAEYVDVRMESFRYHSYHIGNLRAPYIFFWTGNVSARREHILQVGCFDENYKGWGVEDIDLGYRLFLKGLTFSVNMEAKAIHLPHEIETGVKEVLEKDRDMHNKLYFHEKYKNIDSEFLVTGFQDVFFNRDIDFLYENGNNRFDFKQVHVKKIMEKTLDEHAVINGGFNGSITDFCDDSVVLEYDTERYHQLKEYGKIDKVYNSIGTKTFFADRQFEICLITDFWIYLNDSMLSYLTKEAARIANSVFILYQIEIEGREAISISDETWKALLQHLNTLHIDYETYKYEEGGTTFFYLYYGKE